MNLNCRKFYKIRSFFFRMNILNTEEYPQEGYKKPILTKEEAEEIKEEYISRLNFNSLPSGNFTPLFEKEDYLTSDDYLD